MLLLVGAPGIGKTMISSYLVDELDKRAEFTSDMIFAYYFCDNKDDKRNTAIAIIRGLLLQLLRQRPLLFKHIQEDYDQMRDQAFDNFDALWRILLKMLADPNAGQIYLLIDALDECDKSSCGFRQAFLTSLAELFSTQQRSGLMNVKMLITCRPESDILEELNHLRGLICIDSGKINADLLKYIQTRVNELSVKKKYPLKLKKDIQDALSEKAGGTFLWVSLILKDISGTTITSKVRTKLQSLPSSLREVYSRILNKIQEDDVGNARFILQWVITARRPLTIDELAMARALGPEGWDKNIMPTADTLNELNDGFKFCEPLVYLDDATQTINLVHQSVKDYLLEESLPGNSHLSIYRIIPDKANSCILDICWKYLSMKEFRRDTMIIKQAARGDIGRLSQDYLQNRCFLQYAIEEWQEHALAASPAVIMDFAWESDLLNRFSILRDRWLQRAAGKGDDAVVKRLLAANANVNAAAAGHDGRTALQAAAGEGHLEVVERLLTANADVNAAAAGGYGRTALQAAAEKGRLEVVERLLMANADVNAAAAGYYGRTALQAAASGGHLEVVERLLTAKAEIDAAAAAGYSQTTLQVAAGGGHLEVVERLLAANADVNAAAAGYHGRTALQAAAGEGHLEVVKRLLAANANVNAVAGGHDRWTALQAAAEEGHLEIVKRLLAANADVNAAAADHGGRTALQAAAGGGHLETMETLLVTNADVNATAAGHHGRTALQAAAGGGYLEVMERLLAANADVNAAAADHGGGTALQAAAGGGHLEVVERLLAANANVNAAAGHGGRTALQAAAGHEGVIMVLQAAAGPQ
jgi:ankyrin repeat protein